MKRKDIDSQGTCSSTQSDAKSDIGKTRSVKPRFSWPTSHVRISTSVGKSQNPKTGKITSSTCKKNNKLPTKESFSVNTSDAEKIAFEDEFNGLGGSINVAIDIPTDTLAAFQVLKQEFPKYNNLAVIPIMLEHHIYSIIKDRTSALSELDELVSKNVLRKIYITTRADDTAIVFARDYKSIITKKIERYSTGKKLRALKLYIKIIDFIANPSFTLEEFRHCCETVATQDNVMLAKKSCEDSSSDSNPSTLDKTDCEINEQKKGHYSREKCLHILGLLREEGLLLKRGIQQGFESFWIGIPGIGKFCKQIINGRKQVFSIIRRLPFKEILETDLLQRKVKNVDMNIQFFIRDMIGSGKIVALSTTSGTLLRLRNNS